MHRQDDKCTPLESIGLDHVSEAQVPHHSARVDVKDLNHQSHRLDIIEYSSAERYLAEMSGE